MYYKSLLLVFILCLISCNNSKPQALIVLAHFDDESMMSRVLYKLRKTHDLYFVYLTKGEGGSDIRDKSIKGEALSKIRIKENDIVMDLVGAKKRFILGLKDIPLRIPEEGYPNPKGRPTTDVDLFLKAGIWNLESATLEIQKIIDENKLTPQLVYTLSDDKGAVHAHHQSCERIIQKLHFSKNLKGIYGIVESRYYKASKLKKRKNIISVKNENEQMNNFVYEVHQAYKSQMLVNFTKDELSKSVENLYPISQTYSH